jgi:hypothetical protein
VFGASSCARCATAELIIRNASLGKRSTPDDDGWPAHHRNLLVIERNGAKQAHCETLESHRAPARSQEIDVLNNMIRSEKSERDMSKDMSKIYGAV